MTDTSSKRALAYERLEGADRAAQLREALTRADDDVRLIVDRSVIENAALTIALPILEMDDGLVERCFDAIKDDTLFVASIPDRLVAGKDLGRLEREVVAIGLVDAVLAALIPTEGEGE